MQKDVMYGLQQGTAVLKQIQAEMGGIEKVEKLLEENEEARAYEREISELLGGRLTNGEEDEVEDELEALRMEVEGPVEVKVPSLPDAPDTEVVGKEEEERLRKARARARQRGEERTLVAA